MTNQGNCLKIEGNLNRPEINFDGDTGKLIITGRSILENTIKFYEPVIEWVNHYCQNPVEKTELHLKLEYFNTSTSKYLLILFEKLLEIHNEGKDVELLWYYVDEDMRDLGEDYKVIMDIPFKLLEYPKN